MSIDRGSIEYRAAWLLGRLHGKICSDSTMDRDVLEFVQEKNLARFHEWPSGHWQVTNAGWDFREEIFAQAEG